MTPSECPNPILRVLLGSGSPPDAPPEVAFRVLLAWTGQQVLLSLWVPGPTGAGMWVAYLELGSVGGCRVECVDAFDAWLDLAQVVALVLPSIDFPDEWGRRVVRRDADAFSPFSAPRPGPTSETCVRTVGGRCPCPC
jgi:hypothetical protein